MKFEDFDLEGEDFNSQYKEEVLNLDDYLIYLDTNIYMEKSGKYDNFFKYVTNNNINTIMMTSETYDEIVNKRLNSKKNKQDHQFRKALRIVNELDNYNLITIENIKVQPQKNAYADPHIIKYLKDKICDYNIMFVTDDLDLKIRVNQIMKQDNSECNRQDFRIYTGDFFLSTFISLLPRTTYDNHGYIN